MAIEYAYYYIDEFGIPLTIQRRSYNSMFRDVAKAAGDHRIEFIATNTYRIWYPSIMFDRPGQSHDEHESRDVTSFW